VDLEHRLQRGDERILRSCQYRHELGAASAVHHVASDRENSLKPSFGRIDRRCMTASRAEVLESNSPLPLLNIKGHRQVSTLVGPRETLMKACHKDHGAHRVKNEVRLRFRRVEGDAAQRHGGRPQPPSLRLPERRLAEQHADRHTWRKAEASDLMHMSGCNAKVSTLHGPAAKTPVTVPICKHMARDC